MNFFENTSASLSRRAFLGAGALSAAALLAACKKKDSDGAQGGSSDTDSKFRTLDDIKKTGTVNIGVFSDKAPFGYVDANGNYAGYDIVFAERLAKDMGVKINYIATDGQNRVPLLQSNKTDIMLANFTVTDDRKEKVDFSLPYMKIKLGVVSPSSAPITDVSQLDGKKLIVSKGTTAEVWFTKNAPKVELVKFRGDAFSTDNTEVLAWVKSNPGFVVGIDDLGDSDTIAAAVHKGNSSLLEFINNEITGPLAEENFFHKAYEETLAPIYGDEVDPNNIVVEGGKI